MATGEWRRRCKDRPSTALLALWLLTCRAWLFRRKTVATTVALGLVAVSRVLLLVTKLLFFRKCFPLAFLFWWLVLPLFSNNLRDFRVGKTWVLGNDVGLMMLTIKDESLQLVSLDQWDVHLSIYVPLRGLGIFGSG